MWRGSERWSLFMNLMCRNVLNNLKPLHDYLSLCLDFFQEPKLNRTPINLSRIQMSCGFRRTTRKLVNYSWVDWHESKRTEISSSSRIIFNNFLTPPMTKNKNFSARRRQKKLFLNTRHRKGGRQTKANSFLVHCHMAHKFCYWTSKTLQGEHLREKGRKKVCWIIQICSDAENGCKKTS